ncbi:MAG: bifunctional glycosyltransferase family 2/GtrA family protein [Pseudomonadota bacterium]
MPTLSIVIPCYNEEATLAACVERVLDIESEHVKLEIVVVDDCSTDRSVEIATALADEYPQIRLARHSVNQGKGAALRTGFQNVTGDYVAVQDADLEYDPRDLLRLIEPLESGQADVVYGSRFLSGGAHRVLYFWHSMGNRFLTFMSNMLTDLNLTDMETCYKVFKREIIQGIEIKENRFGFEPEITAKIAHMRLRVYEMGISYHGRTYEEGKKIGWRDGVRAIYCVFRYNAHKAPAPVQFLIYLMIGGIAAVANLGIFLGAVSSGLSISMAAPLAFFLAAIINYWLCVWLLFRRHVQWSGNAEWGVYGAVVIAVAIFDLVVTKLAITMGLGLGVSKLLATGLGLVLNFLGRKYFVFRESPSGPWQPSVGE